MKPWNEGAPKFDEDAGSGVMDIFKAKDKGGTAMIVFCEECGERYIIEPEEIKGSEIVFTCRVCKDVIRVRVPNAGDKAGEKATDKDEKK